MSDGLVAIGFDPGLAITGYGVIRMVAGKCEAIAGGVIRTKKDTPRADRLRTLHDEARSLIEAYDPIGMAIEEVFFATNVRSAMRTAEARGAPDMGRPPKLRSRQWFNVCCAYQSSPNRMTWPMDWRWLFVISRKKGG